MFDMKKQEYRERLYGVISSHTVILITLKYANEAKRAVYNLWDMTFLPAETMRWKLKMRLSWMALDTKSGGKMKHVENTQWMNWGLCRDVGREVIGSMIRKSVVYIRIPPHSLPRFNQKKHKPNRGD